MANLQNWFYVISNFDKLANIYSQVYHLLVMLGTPLGQAPALTTHMRQRVNKTP
jgi:hypothetical protein